MLILVDSENGGDSSCAGYAEDLLYAFEQVCDPRLNHQRPAVVVINQTGFREQRPRKRHLSRQGGIGKECKWSIQLQSKVEY